MVMGSVLWMEGVGLGLARNIVQRYALETGSEQGFGIGEKVAHDCVDLDDVACRHKSTGCQTTSERSRVRRCVEHSGSLQQHLRRSAAAKRTDATWIRIGIDQRDLHAKIRGRKRGDVAAWARAYYCDMCFHG
jgi:hypothetical protein